MMIGLIPIAILLALELYKRAQQNRFLAERGTTN